MAAPHDPPPYSGYAPQEGYPQNGPAQGYYPPPGPQIFQNQGPVVYQIPLGTAVIPGAVLMQPAPTTTTPLCRACNRVLVTTLERRPTMTTHCMAALLCVIGFWPCVCLPYCMDSCLGTDICCAHCGAFVAQAI